MSRGLLHQADAVPGLIPVFGSGLTPVTAFGSPIDAANARHIQFSIDFEF